MDEYVRRDGPPLVFPSSCVCGSQKFPMVDTHREVPGFGHVYLCELCVTMAVRALGLWVEKTHHDGVARELDRAKARELELEEQLDEARDPGARTITAGELVAYMTAQAAGEAS